MFSVGKRFTIQFLGNQFLFLLKKAWNSLLNKLFYNIMKMFANIPEFFRYFERLEKLNEKLSLYLTDPLYLQRYKNTVIKINKKSESK